jgi:hypothetical protein
LSSPEGAAQLHAFEHPANPLFKRHAHGSEFGMDARVVRADAYPKDQSPLANLIKRCSLLR